MSRMQNIFNQYIKSLLFMGLFIIFFSFSAHASSPSVKIITDAPCVGTPIEAEIGDASGKLTLKWSVGGEYAAEGYTYTPTAADYESFITVTAADSNGKIISEDSIYFSRLPVVYLTTDDGEPVVSRDEYVDASLYIQGNGEYASQYSGKTEVKGRGTSSWHYDKKPYKLKLDEKSDLFGFGKSKHYVLLANYLDPSMMRNTVADRFSSLLGLCAVDTIWVDLIFNGEYVGCYQLCEHVRIGKQLVDIFNWEDYASDVAEWINEDDKELEEELTEDLSWITEGTVTYNGTEYDLSLYEDYQQAINGGYFFELDSEYDKEISNFQTENGISVCVSSPEYLLTNDTMMAWVQDYFQNVEDAFCSPDGYDKNGKHYTELVDFDSLLNYWLCMEILSNEDAAGRSRFCSIDIDGKLTFGPVWDFDISSGSFRSFYGAKGWNVAGTVNGWYLGQDFWKEIIDDPYFQIKAQERYWEIRPALDELIRDGGIIDEYGEELYEAGCANELLWTGDGYMTRSFTGEKGDIAIYKEFLKERIAWLDGVFESEESTTESMKTFLSANPYKKSSRIKLSIENADSDSGEHGADYYIAGAEAITLSVKLPSGAEAAVYVNGILVDTAQTYSDKIMQCTIPAGYFTEPEGKKNIISVIAKRGGSSYCSYTSIKIGTAENSFTMQDIYEAFCLEENSECSHELVQLEARDASEDRYGINECMYCAKCGRYFSDEGEPLSAKAVLVSLATSDKPGGTPLNVRQLLIIVPLLLLLFFAGLTWLTAFTVKRIRRKKQKNLR